MWSHSPLGCRRLVERHLTGRAWVRCRVLVFRGGDPGCTPVPLVKPIPVTCLSAITADVVPLAGEYVDCGVCVGEELIDVLGAAGHEVHEEVVAEGLWGSKVSLTATHGGHFLYELDELEIIGEHEGVDHDAGALAAGDLFEGFGDDEGIEAKGVFIYAAVFHGEGRGFAVGDHNDLLHVLAGAAEDTLGDAEAFAGIGVVGADFDAGELGERDVLG
jgi:hypothetical protein